MNYKHLASFIAVIVLGLFSAVSPVRANSIPSYPSCTSPSGTLKVSYATGTHWIPIESFLREGSDAVYTLSDTSLLQCYCDLAGHGIQTNWWKISGMSQSDIDTYAGQGWIYIADGSVWGLDASPYLALNSNVSCAGGGNGGYSDPGPGSPPVCDSTRPQAPVITSVVRKGVSATITWNAVAQVTHYTIAYGVEPNKYIYGVPNTGNVTSYTINALDSNTKYYFAVIAVNNCMPSLPSSNVGQVLGVSTLASTGDAVAITSLVTIAALLLILSVFSYRRHRGQ
jgi:hypothetical protein